MTAFFQFHSLGHGRRGKLVKHFSVRLAILNSCKPYEASSSTSGQPVRLHELFLCLNDLTWVHIVSVAMQETGKLITNFIFCFIFGVLSRGFRGLLRPFTSQRGLFVTSTGLLGFLGCEPSPLSLNIYSDAYMRFQNPIRSLMILVDRYKPCTIS